MILLLVKLAPYRTLMVMFVAQSFAQTASPILVLLAGIVGAQMAPSMALATLPVAAMVVGMALTTVPATLLMARYGRKLGFLVAVAYAAIGGLLAAWSVTHSHFIGFCLAALLIGSFTAFLQQFRFAVAESVPPEAIGRSVSILMLAGIVSAIVGPAVATRYSQVDGLAEYAGSFIGMTVLLLMAFLVLLLFYRNQSPEAASSNESPQSYALILQDPAIVLAMASAVAGWSVMTLVMTATPVSMHEMDRHSLADTAWVIQSHILAMYIPSLFSGFLMNLMGVVKVIAIGWLLMLAVVLVGYGEPALMHYWGAMVLLGVGWNFLFVGGTTLLAQSYRAADRFKVQALNDFLVFGLQALASLGAGVLLAFFGWNSVLLLCLPWLILLLPFLWRMRRQ